MTALTENEARWERYREGFNRGSDHVADWQGLPVWLNDMPLRLHDRHPLADMYRKIDLTGDVAPTAADDDGDPVVNHWFSRGRNADVWICRNRETGRPYALTLTRPPDGAMDRLTFWLQTLGAADAWRLDAEHTARTKLHGLLTERQWRQYDLTGSFVERSPRSDLYYLFRRLRPTVVLSTRWPWFQHQHDRMRVLAVLCMHPIGYYEGSWAGCLVPSDDVIAHLIFMRGDEAGFWREANQHDSRSPEAGL